MALNNDVLPSQDAKFDTFQLDFVNTVSINQIAWGITTDEITVLTNAQGFWKTAWQVARNYKNRTTAQVTAKIEARKGYAKVLRPFIKTRIYGNALLTAQDIENCGLKPHKTTRTPIGRPTGTPMVTALADAGNGMRFYFSPPKAEDGSTRRGKPKGVTGIKVVLQVGGEPPKGPEVCTISYQVSRSPRRFSFNPEQIGTRVYLFACWLNSKGEQGPWTTLQQFIIS